MRAPDISFAEQQMFLRMRFTAIRSWKRVNPDEGLRHRLNFQVIECESGLLVNEAGAKWLIGIVQIKCGGAKSVYRLPFSQSCEWDGLLSEAGPRNRGKQQAHH